jgi:hypothetical protein
MLNVSRERHCACIDELKADKYCTANLDSFEKPVFLTDGQRTCLNAKNAAAP